MYLSNNKGLTLVELLATITILSIVSTIVWGVLINGHKASDITKSNVYLQQYAHEIFLALQNAHQLSNSYTISLDRNPKAQSITITGKDTLTITDPNIEFSFYIFDSNHQPQLIGNQLIIDSKNQDLNFKMVFNHINNPPNPGNEEDPSMTFTLKTIFEKKSALTD